MYTKKIAKYVLIRWPFLQPLVDITRTLLAPREQFSVWKDFMATRDQTVWMRDHRSLKKINKRVLIVLSTDMVYETKLLAMLAFGLKINGWDVKIFLSRVCLWAQRYFKSFGISDFVYWENYALTDEEKVQRSKEAEAFLSGKMTFQSVKSWKYGAAWIGPQILSSVARRMMCGTPDVNDPAVKKYIAEILPETLEMVHIAEKLLTQLQPQLITLNEANYTLMGALVDTAVSRAIDVIQMIQSARDDALIFKRLTRETRRSHPASVSKDSLESFAKLPWNEEYEKMLAEEFKNRYGGAWFIQNRNQPGVKKKSKEEIINELKLDLHKKTAVVFSPLLWDANLFYGEDIFEDFGDWFKETVRAACANPNINWIIKMHPANLWKRARDNVASEFAEVALIEKTVGKLPSHVVLLYPNTDISTWSLFELADYGVTVRGTVGMELPCLGKSVFTAGTGRYSGLGFTIDSTTKEEYLEKLSRIHEFGSLGDEQTLIAKKHAFITFKLRPWYMKSFKASFAYKQKGVHPLDHNLLVNVDSMEQLMKNSDLEKWAEWAGTKDAVDYLGTPENPGIISELESLRKSNAS